jgi:hypothetical protein
MIINTVWSMPVSRNTPIDSNLARDILIIFSLPFYQGAQEGAMLHRDIILGQQFLNDRTYSRR